MHRMEHGVLCAFSCVGLVAGLAACGPKIKVTDANKNGNGYMTFKVDGPADIVVKAIGPNGKPIGGAKLGNGNFDVVVSTAMLPKGKSDIEFQAEDQKGKTSKTTVSVERPAVTPTVSFLTTANVPEQMPTSWVG